MEKIEFRLARTQYMIEEGQVEKESATFVSFKRTKPNVKSSLYSLYSFNTDLYKRSVLKLN